MGGSVLDDLLAEWSNKYELRHIDNTGEYRGIIDRVCINASVVDGEIYSRFFSPSTSLIGQIASEFTGFHNFATCGVASRALNGTIIDGKLDEHSCVLKLSLGQLRAIEPDTFMEIPALSADDFVAHGAQPLVCSQCGSLDPDQVAQFGDVYQIMCDSCFEAIIDEAEAEPHKNAVESRVNWPMAVLATIGSTIAFGLLWGFFQFSRDRLPFLLLVLVPAIGVSLHTAFIVRLANGVSPFLARVIYISAMVWILMGNIIGWSFVLKANGIEGTWDKIIMAYFVQWLPVAWDSEGWFFAGGLFGIYCTLGRIRQQTMSDVVKRM